MTNLLELNGLTKAFGSLVAVDRVDFDLRPGEIHTVLGENGAGKSTLMNLIFGLYRPDAGEIRVSDQAAQFASPRDAIRAGIGMVHQHFMLVQNLTVAENLALGLPDRPFRFRQSSASQKTRELSDRYGFAVDPDAQVWQLSVGLQQRVEILKALSADAKILILDEPTAVLAPQEVEELFGILQRLREDDHAIIFISHKLKEVMRISDRVTVLRRGQKVHTVEASQTSTSDLAYHMMGHELQPLEPEPVELGECVLAVRDLVVRGNREEIAVDHISLDLHRGEILGIAGVDGNGQVEFAESLMGLREVESGSIEVQSISVAGNSPASMRGRGVGFIPEDRHAVGLVVDFSVTENLMLDIHRLRDYRKWLLLDKKGIANQAENLIGDYRISTPSRNAAARVLSGGNQQKIVLAREISGNPDVLIAVNPTRGLDIGATEYVHKSLLEQRRRSKAVLLVSTELDEVLALSDRLFVMYRGSLIDATAQRDSLTALGLLMTGLAAD